MLRDRGRRGLDDEHVRTPDRVLEAEVRRAVGKRRPLHPGQLHAEMPGDLVGKLGVRAPRDDGEPLRRGQRHGTADCEVSQRGPARALESRQRLLNRSAFHLALPC